MARFYLGKDETGKDLYGEGKYPYVDLRGRIPGSPQPNQGTVYKDSGVIWHWNGPKVVNGDLDQLVIDARYHMRPDAFGPGATPNGIQYEWAVGHDGTKYRLRNPGASLWHCGNALYNAGAFAATFLIGEGQRITAAAKESARELTDALLRIQGLGREGCRGHRDVNPSTCPGTAYSDFVLPYRAGKLSPDVPVKPAPTGGLTRLKVPGQQVEAFRDESRAAFLVSNLEKAGVPRAKIAKVSEGGYHKVRLLAYQHGAYATEAKLTEARGKLSALGVETTTEKTSSAPPKPSPHPTNALDKMVEEAIAFGRQMVGAPYGTGWEEGTWPDLSPLYARIGKHDPPSYYRSRYIVCSGLINVLRYEIAGLPAVGRAQGDPYPGGTAAIGRTLAKMPGCKPYPPVENTPRGWLVFSPYLGSRLALQGHVGVALGDGRVLEARVPNASENRTEDQGSRALVAGGGKPYTTVIPPEIWLRK